jgi:hypothetical protein
MVFQTAFPIVCSIFAKADPEQYAIYLTFIDETADIISPKQEYFCGQCPHAHLADAKTPALVRVRLHQSKTAT